MTVLIKTLRGCASFLALALNTALAALPILFLSLLKFLVPVASWRRTCSDLLNRVAGFWIRCNEVWLPKPEEVIWANFEPVSLEEDQSYLITSNHQSWADIFLVQYLLNQRIPQIKFFLKQELMWVPIIGLCWWALDFPYMKRYSKSYLKKNPEKKGKDQLTTIRACEKFRDAPVAIYNFMEGTRFTDEKHRRQQSPYRHLLKPKGGGTGLVLTALGEQIDVLLDITISYAGKAPGFWDLLGGDNGDAVIRIEKVDIPSRLRGRDYGNDPEYRTDLLNWVNELWQKKDRLLEEMRPKKGDRDETPEKTRTGEESGEGPPDEK